MPPFPPEAEPLNTTRPDTAALRRALEQGEDGLAARLVRAVLDAAGVPLAGPVSPGPREGGFPHEAAAVLDHAGHFSSVAMAARSTLHLYDGHESWAVGLEDLEEEQGRDLAVRLSGVATVVSALPGGMSAARETGTFAALVWYLAAVDVVLAYGTEMDPVEAGHVAGVVARHEPAVSEIRIALGGGQDAADALDGLVAEVEDAVSALPDVVAVVAAAVRGVLPEIESSTEAFQAEAASTPAVGLLIARLQAEMEGTLGDAPATRPPQTRTPPRGAGRHTPRASPSEPGSLPGLLPWENRGNDSLLVEPRTTPFQSRRPTPRTTPAYKRPEDSSTKPRGVMLTPSPHPPRSSLRRHDGPPVQRPVRRKRDGSPRRAPHSIQPTMPSRQRELPSTASMPTKPHARPERAASGSFGTADSKSSPGALLLVGNGGVSRSGSQPFRRLSSAAPAHRTMASVR
ncbi:MAG: hypothetical protein VX265_14215 [Myxococcota bacterium]|nr:hypothetical protein [Myxococcota bacterium]